MRPIYQIYPGEITAKGKAYLVIEQCRADELDEVLAQGREKLLSLGATELFVTSHDPAAPLEEGCREGCRLEFVRDMLILQRDLSQLPGQCQRLSMEPLTRERGGAWLALHNECFFEMPNSATYGPQDLDRALEEGHRCGFAVVNGVRIGVYELDLTQEIPEIEGIALHKDVRGQGLGRELLRGAMALLGEAGFDQCKLLVASDNESAFSLYRRTGFKAAGIQSKWFRMLPNRVKTSG
ncbi:GNAT family N-acetyltransferase [Flavonifractor porci]|uniref:GNAT family N-acetyltransferase n=1 Tax=Flavonifractor porci TaxID=3133422 RepID=UPI0030AFA874